MLPDSIDASSTLRLFLASHLTRSHLWIQWCHTKWIHKLMHHHWLHRNPLKSTRSQQSKTTMRYVTWFIHILIECQVATAKNWMNKLPAIMETQKKVFDLRIASSYLTIGTHMWFTIYLICPLIWATFRQSFQRVWFVWLLPNIWHIRVVI